MALSNILVSNVNNIYSNSLTMNPVPTKPVAGDNTLWINSADNDLYFGNTDISNVPIIVASKYTPTIVSQNAKFVQFRRAHYMRIGNYVTVWINFSSSASDSLVTSVKVSLPIQPTLAAIQNTIIAPPTPIVGTTSFNMFRYGSTSPDFTLNYSSSNAFTTNAVYDFTFSYCLVSS